MNSLRLFFRRHRRLAVLLIGLTLAIKALVPAGYMVGSQARVLTIEICADTLGGAKLTREIVVPHQAAPGSAASEHGKTPGVCAYAGLAMDGLAGTAPALLALALAFILTLGFAAPRALPQRRHAHLRPPLRGPPVFA